MNSTKEHWLGLLLVVGGIIAVLLLYSWGFLSQSTIGIFIVTIISGAIISGATIFYRGIKQTSKSTGQGLGTDLYSVGDFVETRPIPPNLAVLTKEEGQRLQREYREKLSKYEQDLVERYNAENLIVWNGKQHPVSVLLEVRCEEDQVQEKFDVDANGRVREYKIPSVILEWGKEELLRFMKEDPLVKNPDFPDFPNSEIAHFEKFEYLNEKLIIWYQKSSFYDYVLTILSMDVWSKSKAMKLRDILEPGGTQLKGRLRSVEESLCAGTLGVNCIVKTKDGLFVVSKRSGNVSNAKYTLVGSATGFLRWDMRRNMGSPPSIFFAVKRHLYEEMEVQEYEVRQIMCIGMVRDLERAQQTDAVFYVETTLNFQELEQRRALAPHRREIAHYVPIEPKKITEYMVNPDSSPELIGCIYLLVKVARDKIQ
jgi:hypothetical protein